jgi:DNA replication protein DnaC
MSLHETLNRIFDLQKLWSAKNTPEMQERHDKFKELKNLITNKNKTFLDEISFKSKIGTGVGPKAQVPWVSFYHSDFSTGGQQGFYLVYLFSLDGSRLYLSLNQGTTYGKNAKLKPDFFIKNNINSAKNTLTNYNKELRKTRYIDKIDLTDHINKTPLTRTAKSYPKGHISGIFYDRENLPPEEIFYSDLQLLCEAQKRIYKSNRKYWLYSPGEGASLWKENFDKGEMRIGNLKEDLFEFSDKETLESKLTERRKDTARPINDSKAYWQFAYEINIGDVIIPKKGSTTYLGYGLVKEDYKYEAEHEKYYHRRKISWIKNDEWKDELGPIVVKTLTNITDLKSESTEHEYYVDRLRALIGIPEDLDRSADQVLGINWLTETTHLKKDFLEEIVEELESPKGGQIILAGPPGTGKTWVAEHLAKYLTKDNENLYKVVQFHPSYGYEDFVEGLRPQIKDGGKLIFEPTHGHVLKIAKLARENPSDNYVLVLDEINRANLPKVLGELLYLLEYREKKIDLQYSPNFSLPQNLKFVGTMNTADRSIRSIDAAIRRRFNFFDLNPSLEVLKSHHLLNDESEFLKGFKSLNESLVKDYDEHHAIGHSYFMGCYCREDLEKVWKREIFPLLQEYLIDWSKEELEEKYSIEKFWGDWKKNDSPPQS